MVFTTKAMISKTLFPKIQVYYFDTLYGGIGWKILFKLYMGRIWFIPNPFLKYQDEYDMPSCRYGNGEMMNGDVYEKLHIVT